MFDIEELMGFTDYKEAEKIPYEKFIKIEKGIYLCREWCDFRGFTIKPGMLYISPETTKSFETENQIFAIRQYNGDRYIGAKVLIECKPEVADFECGMVIPYMVYKDRLPAWGMVDGQWKRTYIDAKKGFEKLEKLIRDLMMFGEDFEDIFNQRPDDLYNGPSLKIVYNHGYNCIWYLKTEIPGLYIFVEPKSVNGDCGVKDWHRFFICWLTLSEVVDSVASDREVVIQTNKVYKNQALHQLKVFFKEL